MPELGHWSELPGGGIDDGETYVETAVRELREETGIHIGPEQVGSPTWRRTASFRHRNTRRLQHEVVAAVRLTVVGPDVERTEAVVLSHEQGACKPAEVLLLRACRLLDVPPRETIMVGDNPNADGGVVVAGLTVLLLPQMTADWTHDLGAALACCADVDGPPGESGRRRPVHGCRPATGAPVCQLPAGRWRRAPAPSARRRGGGGRLWSGCAPAPRPQGEPRGRALARPVAKDRPTGHRC